MPRSNLRKPRQLIPRKSRPAGSAIALSIAFLVLVLISPVSFERESSQGPVDENSFQWERISKSIESSVSVTTEQRGTLGVKFVGVFPETIDKSLVRVVPDQPRISSEDGHLCQSPCSFQFSGVFSDLVIQVTDLNTVESFLVTRMSENSTVTFDFSIDDGDFFRVPSYEHSFKRTVTLGESLIQPFFSPGSVEIYPSSVGNAEIVPGLENPIPTLIVGAVKNIFEGLLVLGKAGLVLLLAYTISVLVWPKAKMATQSPGLRIAAGFALVALVSNSLSYVVPVSWVAAILPGIAFVLFLFRFMRKKITFSILTSHLLTFWSAVKLPYLFASLLFFPIFFWGTRFVGSYKTDLYEYVNLVSFLRGNSLRDLRSVPDVELAGGFTAGAGFEWRSIDSVSAALVGELTFSYSRDAVLILSIVLFLIFCTTLFDLAGSSPRAKLFLTVGLLSPAFVGLFLENYLSHYYFVALIPAVALALRPVEVPEHGLGLFRLGASDVQLSLLLAVSVAVYPAFSIFVLFGALGAIGIMHRKRLMLALIKATSVGAASIGFLNLGLFSIGGLISADNYRDGLDGITRWILLEPYTTISDGIVLSAGGLGYQLRYPDQNEPYMGNVWGSLWPILEALWVRRLDGVLILVFALFLLAAVFSVPKLSKRLQVELYFSALLFGLIGVGALVAIAIGHLYLPFKLVWTLVALVPLIFVFLGHQERIPQKAATILLLPLMFLWGVVGVGEKLHWVMNRDGGSALRTHTPLERDISHVRVALENDRTNTVEIVLGDQYLKGSDQDRILVNQISADVRDLGLSCRGCLEPLDQVSGLSDLVIFIGITSSKSIEGYHYEPGGRLVELHRTE